MGNIVLLDDLTINQIAAGEVIERPASVIKELVENAIDAGADNINVEIKNGGISYIRVTDNGKGILPDDMEIAFERHATSKIRSADDLNTVKSMGFRGEALASIAAIARVTMNSKTVEAPTGYSLVIEGGDILSKEEIGCPKGTSITVENLFYNTPVRYKFLKKDFTETGYIEDVMTRIALVNPQIAVKLVNTGKTVLQTSGNGDMKSVIYSIYGKDIAENILPVEYEYEEIKIKGVIGKPVIARSNRSNQLFFVNKRYIKDKALTSSAEQAYKGMITIGKFGFLILNLEMNPEKVDVNVHPAKLEVRFQEESKVFKAVYHAIKDTLLKEDLISDTVKEKDETKIFDQKQVEQLEQVQAEERAKKEGLFQKFRNRKQEEIVPTVPKNNLLEQIYQSRKEDTSSIVAEESGLYHCEPTAQVASFNNNINEDKQEKRQEVVEAVKESNEKFDGLMKQMQEMRNGIEKDKKEMNNKEEKDIQEQEEKTPDEQMAQALAEKGDAITFEEFDKMYEKIFGKQPATPEEQKKKEGIQNQFDIPITTGETISVFEKIEEKQSYRFIGIAFSTYIIIEMGKELYMIDQHAAHERVLYEKVKKNYYSDEVKESQLMLLPDIITLSHKEMQIAKDNMDMFKKAGFELEEFGENTIKLTGVPSICLDLDTKELFLETLDEINTVARTAKQEIEERFIATVACKAAVKANMVLTKQEVDNLMNELLQLPNPFTCPHGRPTAIKMTKTDLEKKFSRR